MPRMRTSPAGVGCSQSDTAREKGEIAVLRERRSHSAGRKQRITKHDHQSFWFVTAGLRRSIAKMSGHKGEPAGIQARNPREDGFNKWKGDLLRISKEPSFVFVLVAIRKTKSFQLSLTKQSFVLLSGICGVSRECSTNHHGTAFLKR